MLIRSTIGAGFGVIFSVLLFKRRSWPVFTGLGFGAGRAWEECDSVSLPSTKIGQEQMVLDPCNSRYGADKQKQLCGYNIVSKSVHFAKKMLTLGLQSFKRATAPSRDGLRVLRP